MEAVPPAPRKQSPHSQNSATGRFLATALVPPPPTRTQFPREEAVPALEGWGVGGRQRGGAEPGREGAERGNEPEGGAGRGSEGVCYLLIT